jgi:tRNA threonylcarbamoyladenosine biosynthesis protein TsaE
LPTLKNKFLFRSVGETKRWAARFARTLNARDIVALVGPLGAGKTTLVQGLASGWGYYGEVTSPTFALVNEYGSAKGPLYHMDMYRLTKAEVAQFPLDDYVNAGLCVIEWADRLRERLPRPVRVLELEIIDPVLRRLTLRQW